MNKTVKDLLIFLAGLGLTVMCCQAGWEAGKIEGRNQVCKQVCPTDSFRIVENQCECVVEKTVSPTRIVLR